MVVAFNTLSNADALSTTATPDTSTNYVVIVRDINGCVGPDTVRILIDTIDVALGGKEDIALEGLIQL